MTKCNPVIWINHGQSLLNLLFNPDMVNTTIVATSEVKTKLGKRSTKN